LLKLFLNLVILGEDFFELNVLLEGVNISDAYLFIGGGGASEINLCFFYGITYGFAF
jgi:hypothetical protein